MLDPGGTERYNQTSAPNRAKALLRRQPGVLSTRVGYTGGDVPNATYRNRGTHAEGIEVVFDPRQISFRQILEFFFQFHDPSTPNRQGNDLGASYRSAIFFGERGEFFSARGATGKSGFRFFPAGGGVQTHTPPYE